MQFSCESCRAQLQIADEKVRGKRLIVRCRRCGSKIELADPSLADSSPRLIERSPAPARMRITPRPEPAQEKPEDESTRAMDREVLERALEASKADEGPHNGAPATQKLHFPRPAAPPDQLEWFAMIRGKQTGPLPQEELIERANEGEIGPRTYLWREGMDAWQRALDVPELSQMFPHVPPVAARPPPPAPPAAPPPSGPLPQPSHPRHVAVPTPQPAAAPPDEGPPAKALDLSRWSTAEMQRPEQPPQPATAPEDPPAQPRNPRRSVQRSLPMFENTTPLERGPFTVFLGLMALAAAAIALWIVLAPTKREEARGPPPAGVAQPAAPAETASPPVAPPPALPDAKPADQAPAPAKAQVPPQEAVPAPPSATGLTADQVHRKLDENKPALQGCVDEALRRDPQLKVGKIHVATTIAPSGAVTAARIDQPSVDESPLGACLKRVTKRIEFPQFAGSAFDVDIPIVVTAESP